MHSVRVQVRSRKVYDTRNKRGPGHASYSAQQEERKSHNRTSREENRLEMQGWAQELMLICLILVSGEVDEVKLVPRLSSDNQVEGAEALSPNSAQHDQQMLLCKCIH